jgi:hypothetical protein
MKRLSLLVVGVFVVAALGSTASNTAAGSSRPLGHVVGDFTAQSVWHGDPTRPEPPFIVIERVTVNAFDRTLELPVDPRTPTTDGGMFSVSYGGETFTFPIANVSISGDGRTASVYTNALGSLGFYVFHDGGAPGNEIIGPPDPLEAGVSPTRDWYGLTSFNFPGYFYVRGQLTSGNVRITVS